MRASAFGITQPFPCGRVAATRPNSHCHYSQSLCHPCTLICADSKEGGGSGGTLPSTFGHSVTAHTFAFLVIFSFIVASMSQALTQSHRRWLLSTAFHGLSCLRPPRPVLNSLPSLTFQPWENPHVASFQLSALAPLRCWRKPPNRSISAPQVGRWSDPRARPAPRLLSCCASLISAQS